MAEGLTLRTPEWFTSPAAKRGALRDLFEATSTGVSLAWGDLCEAERRAARRRREQDAKRARESRSILRRALNHPQDLFRDVEVHGKTRREKRVSVARYLHERGDDV